MKLTLKEARDQLYNAVVPNLNSQENIDTFNQYLNWAQERLINSGKWNGMVIPVIFTVPFENDDSLRHITLPPRFVSVLAMRMRNNGNGLIGGCCVAPVRILNQWFSYTSPTPACYNFQLWPGYGYYSFGPYTRDQGDGFVTFRDSPYASYYLKITLENIEDSGLEVLVKGYDASGDRIFTPDSSYAYEGTTIQVNYPSTQTSQVFTKDLYFFGKTPTQGYVFLDAVDTVTGESTRIGHYWPSEVNSCYHRYWVGKVCSSNVGFVECLCKLRYMPALSDQDEIWPANLGALRNMLAALVYEANSDPGRYEDYFQRALKLLNDESRESRGGAAFRLNIDAGAFGLQNIYQGR